MPRELRDRHGIAFGLLNVGPVKCLGASRSVDDVKNKLAARWRDQQAAGITISGTGSPLKNRPRFTGAVGATEKKSLKKKVSPVRLERRPAGAQK